MTTIFGKIKICWKLGWLLCGEIPCRSKISSKLLYLARFSRYKHFCVCNFCGKFKMAAIFGEIIFFDLRVKKNHWNHFISHGFRNINISVLCNFCQIFENSKWLPFLTRQKFFESWDGYSLEIPCGSKLSSKSLYLARFFRYKHFFSNFCEKNIKFKMAAIFGDTKIFWKLGWLLCWGT